MRKNGTAGRRLCAAALAAAALFAAASAQPPAAPRSETATAPAEFFGRLDDAPAPDATKSYGIVFEPVRDAARFRLAKPPEAGARLAAGEIYDGRRAGGRLGLLLVEPPAGAPRVCADRDADGKTAEAECSAFVPAGRAGRFYQLLKLPLKNSFYEYYPVLLQFEQGAQYQGLRADQRLVFQTIGAFAGGEVSIDGRAVRVQYPFDPEKPGISTTEGLFGIDVDGDGRIRNEPFSPETSYASDAELVFRLGARYVSTSRIDAAKKQIVMRARPESEYRRRELAVGAEMADFAFTDFDDRRRSLKEFRGKYLLVDFWGVWCVDCRREVPFQVEAVRRFKDRGFEILGIDSDEADKMKEVRAYLAANKMTWTQAQFASVKDLIETEYRIQEYPSAVLLDPQGRVLVLDQQELSGPRLLETLDRLLPKP